MHVFCCIFPAFATFALVQLMSLSDLVYNHTDKDSPWVWQHPECTFNMVNSPHLRPAYIMDRIFEHFSLEVGRGEWESHGIPKCVHTEDHLNVSRRTTSLVGMKINDVFLLESA